MKKKLLVLLGAGSSLEQGFPSTGDLNRELLDRARRFVETKQPDPIDSYNSRTHANYFGLLWANRENYCAEFNVEPMASRVTPNYERVLGDLHALMNGVLSKPYGDPILKWIPKADVFSQLKIVPDTSDLDAHGSGKIFYAVQGQLMHLCDVVAGRIRDNSCLFEYELSSGRGTEAFAPYLRLMNGLAREFEIGVYNLNYDTVALNALPDSFVGFDKKSGDFLPTEVLGRIDWHFLYHLHGSVHHRMKEGSHTMYDDDFGPRISWDNDISQNDDNEDWEDSANLTTQSDEKRVLLTTLVAGGWKLDQLQVEPFLTLYSCFSRHVYEADAILIGGYGFGDSHINSIIRNALLSKARMNARPPVVVLDYERNRRPTAWREGPWSPAMGKTLNVPPQSFRDPTNRQQPNYFKLTEPVPAGEFETSLRAPVAIWSGGLKSAAEKTSSIAEWLNGNHSALDCVRRG